MSSDNQLPTSGSPVGYADAQPGSRVEDQFSSDSTRNISSSISVQNHDAPDLPVQADPVKVTTGKSNYQRRAKPPFSYIALIAMAIQDSQTQKLTLAEINDYLMKKFPFFTGEYTGWRNSVRHNLSLNECFQKVLRDPSRPWGKDNYWTLNESSDYTFADGVFRRRRKRLHKKPKGKAAHAAAAAPVVAVAADSGKAYVRMMNNFNPEHKHDVAKARQSSFLIDDLLAGERCTSEVENSTTEDVTAISSRHSTTAPLLHRSHSGSSSSSRRRRRDRSQCEQGIQQHSSSPPAASTTHHQHSSKLSIKTASSSLATSTHHPTHSSSPLRSPSVSSSSSSSLRSQAAASASDVTVKAKYADNVNTPRQYDGCEKLWAKYEQKIGLARPQLLRYELPASGLPYPFCWPYLSHHHQHQAAMTTTAQPFTPRTYPFSANTLAANLYPFLSTQQALQMSSGVDSNDLSQQLAALAGFPHFSLKPYS